MSYQSILESRGASSGLLACLIPLLDAIGWRGQRSQVDAALPHFAKKLSRTQFLNTMANLNLHAKEINLSLNKIDASMLPCLFINKGGNPLVLLKRQDRHFLAFDGQASDYRQIDPARTRGKVYQFTPLDKMGLNPRESQSQWFIKILSRFWPQGRAVLLLSFLLNLLALATPFFVMTIYDRVLYLDNYQTLGYLVAGVLVFVLSDFILRLIRINVLTGAGARLGHITDTEVFRRILYLAPAYTESAPVSSQINRIRDFSTVSDFFSGRPLISLMDIPFTILLLMGMAFIGGWLAAVPVCAMLVFGTVAFFLIPVVDRVNQEYAQSTGKRQELFLEMLLRLRAIKSTGAQDTWLNRYHQRSAQATLDYHRSAQVISFINTMAHFITMLAGMATIAIGVSGVLNQTMSMGALVASMMLVWRILTPLFTSFGVLMQIQRIQKSVTQVDRLMNMELEKNIQANSDYQSQKGGVVFRNVSMRYVAEAQPALLGVSFQALPRELTVICGHHGAGKSTVLKLILCMYQPQAGQVLLGGNNTRQIEPAVLRNSIGYAPQEPYFFYGTVEQNLRLADSRVPDHKIEKLCRILGLDQEVERLAEGWETRIGHQKKWQIPDSFWWKYGMARALIRNASLYLFDEVLDKVESPRLDTVLSLLEETKNNSSIILVSNRAEFLKVADRVLWLEEGRIRMAGPSEQVAQAFFNGEKDLNRTES